MRVLIACEFSGIVRDAFRARGHDAWSCDLLPSESDPRWHLQQDARTAIEAIGADSTGDPHLIIAHPPCTYLCNSGVRWLAPGGKLDAKRHKLMQKACDFFATLYWANVPHVAVENPVMHGYARDYLQSAWKVPPFSFSIQPWQFGEPEIKRTCFWVRSLPTLQPTKIVSGRTARVHRASPGVDRWKERSRTLPGIAEAMAAQWGDFVSKQQNAGATRHNGK